ncbi:IMP cyclohydrolase [Streptacidiphilus cavernicola]|uniref:IMP cyclohydrolase n=1 Tax=Streptacidiphilus cavernicola TaxID=3342716 RepID=A0ABV6W4B7_9ACTN
MIPELTELLTGNPYPGRGVLCCRTADGVLSGGYFLTGRSGASRARELRRGPAGELTVAPTAPTSPTAPTAPTGHDSLRHYTAVRESADCLVFGNGEQVGAVAARLAAGLRPAEALDGLDYEPDPPIFTPRLTAVVENGAVGDGAVWFGAARRSAAGRAATDRMTLRVEGLRAGEGVLMTTYRSDGVEVATGEPYAEFRTAAAGPGELLDQLWDRLDARLRVAAAVFEPGRLPEAEIRQAR